MPSSIKLTQIKLQVEIFSLDFGTKYLNDQENIYLLKRIYLFIYLFNYLFIYLSQCEQTGRHIHICSHIDQKKAQGNVSIPLQRVFWCSLYKSYILQIYFTKPTRTLQRDPFINFPFKSTLSLR